VHRAGCSSLNGPKDTGPCCPPIVDCVKGGTIYSASLFDPQGKELCARAAAVHPWSTAGQEAQPGWCVRGESWQLKNAGVPVRTPNILCGDFSLIITLTVPFSYRDLTCFWVVVPTPSYFETTCRYVPEALPTAMQAVWSACIGSTLHDSDPYSSCEPQRAHKLVLPTPMHS
jgi:hypothetical protein